MSCAVIRVLPQYRMFDVRPVSLSPYLPITSLTM